MTAARTVTLFLALSAASAAAATRDEPPDREMLKMMEFLKEMEMIKQMEMLRDMQVVEASGEPAKSAPAQKPPPRKRETSK